METRPGGVNHVVAWRGLNYLVSCCGGGGGEERGGGGEGGGEGGYGVFRRMSCA